MKFKSKHKTFLTGLVLAMAIALLGSYTIFNLLDYQSAPRQLETTLIATADLRHDATPFLPYAGVDAAAVALLMHTNPYGNLITPVPGVPPIGSYLPAVRDLPSATPPPTLAPAATLTRAETLLAPAAILDYAGDDCAPAGMPLLGVLTQRYHSRHSGIDLGAPVGTPVLATQSGMITFAGWSSVGYGYLIIIENGRFSTYYAHLSNFNVKKGDQVGSGSVIGWSGNTGNSSGPHIHYEIRIDAATVDPATFEQRGYKNC